MAYCNRADIIDLMSAEGVNSAGSDVSTDDPASTLIINNVIERAEARVNQYVAKKYDTSLLSRSNTWIKWACATLAALELMRRRGNAAPIGLQDKADEILEHLKAIQGGTGEIPGQTPNHEPGLTMTNIRVDNRFRVKKQRAVVPTSVGQQDSEKSRHTDRRSERYDFF